LRSLQEDELVQITERPWLAGYRLVVASAIEAFLDHMKAHPGAKRMDLFREIQKRLLRMGAYLEFHTLDAESTATLAREAVEEAAASFKRSS
jgi:hypothetical protein